MISIGRGTGSSCGTWPRSTRSSGRARSSSGARSLGYSQSAVSEQIATLEEIVGGRTVERSPGRRGVQPTAIGLILLRHSENITSSVNAAWADIRALSNARRTLRVGIFPSASVRLLPPIVRALHREQPDLELLLHEALDPGELFDLVADGKLDIAFGNPTVAPPSLTTVELLEDPYVLLVAADHPLTTAPSVSPSEIAQLPLIDYRSIRPELLPTSRLPRHRAAAKRRVPDRRRPHRACARRFGSRLRARLEAQRRPRRRTRPIDSDRPAAATSSTRARLARRPGPVACARRLRSSGAANRIRGGTAASGGRVG